MVGSDIAWEHFFIPLSVGQISMQTISFDTALTNDFAILGNCGIALVTALSCL